MLELDQVTLCCVDGRNHAMALRALERSRRDIRFARTVFLTNTVPRHIGIPNGIEVISAGSLASEEAYSHLVLKGIYPYLLTPYVLLVQWDGYVVHPQMWQDEFLDADYLGAAWPNEEGAFSVGNGGFSLRSRKLLAALQDDTFPLLTSNEDVTICGFHRARLESEFGIRFGSPELARQFSFEMETGYVIGGAKTFGFHGIFNLFLVETQQEITAISRALPDNIACLQSVELLLGNLMQFEMLQPSLALGQRILAVVPENDFAAGVVVRVREMLAQKNEAPAQKRSRMVDRLMRGFRTRRP